MKNKITFFVLLLSITFCSAQKAPFMDHYFSDEEIEIPAEFKDKNEVLLFVNRKIAYVSTERTVEEYMLVHEKTLVNSDEAIEKNNRIYISYNESEKILKNANRVILPDGEIIILDKEDILEETDTETGRSYEYYAVKGLVKGAIIETIYVKQVRPNLNDKLLSFQYSTPIVKSTFELIHPDYLTFKYKSYNGLAEAVETELEKEDKISIRVESNNIPALNSNEKLANPNRHRQLFRYRLYGNKNSGAKNFYNYNEFVSNAYPNLSYRLTKKEQKALDKFIRDIELTDDALNNILTIEHLVKTSIVNDNYYGENEDISDILKAKKGSVIDAIILYKAIFDELEIPAEFIFTTDRFEIPFDKEFETTSNLTYGLIYFPELDICLDPRNTSLRVPLINDNHTHNYGIRFKEKEFANEIMAVADLFYIKPIGMEITTDTMKIVVDFTENIDNPSIKSNINFGGYSGAYLQGIVDLVPEDQYEEIIDDILKNYSANVEMDKKEILNNGLAYAGRENFTLELEFQGEELVQKAGDKYLFKIGQTIGKQQEIYQTEDRTLPVEISYPHYYFRTLEVRVPSGYKITNPESAEFDYKVIMDGKEEAVFISKVNQNEKVYKIENIEYYDRVMFPLDQFESYKAVLNAAADFNKIVWVLEKE